MNTIFFTKKPVDKVLLFSFISLIVLALFAFLSASLSLSAKSVNFFWSSLFKQIVIGYGLGTLIAYFTSKINYKFFRIFAIHFFVFAIFLNLLVFIPFLGVTKNGATRWIEIFGFSFQPSELLKIASIIFLSHILTVYAKKAKYIQYGVAPAFALIILVGIILYFQSDTGTLVTIVASILTILFVSKIQTKHIFVLLGIVFAMGVLFVLLKPHAISRIMTYINPSDDLFTTDYHVNQAMISIGSGQLMGRGFGQSLQKFKFLPEPTSDSIFAVYAEEFGFVGSVFFVLLFALFLFAILRIGTLSLQKKKDYFAYLVSIGIFAYLFVQFLLNVGSMSGILPLTGITLPFVSKGVSSLLVGFLSVGIVFSISRNLHTRKRLSFTQ